MVQNSNKLRLYQKVLILFAILLVSFGMWYFETGCLVQRFVHIPCLTCGMTRAFFYLINGRFALSFNTHPMLLSVPILGVMFLFSNTFFYGRLKKYSIGLLILIVFGFVINYFRMF